MTDVFTIGAIDLPDNELQLVEEEDPGEDDAVHSENEPDSLEVSWRTDSCSWLEALKQTLVRCHHGAHDDSLKHFFYRTTIQTMPRWAPARQCQWTSSKRASAPTLPTMAVLATDGDFITASKALSGNQPQTPSTACKCT